MTYWSAAFRSPFFGPKPRGRDQSICNDRMCFKHSWNFLTFDANTWNLHLTDWTNVMWRANKFSCFTFFQGKKTHLKIVATHVVEGSILHFAQITWFRFNIPENSWISQDHPYPLLRVIAQKKQKYHDHPWSSMVSQNISKCSMSHPYINHHGAFVHPCLSCTKYKVMRQLEVWHIALGNRKMPHWSFPDS